MGSTDRASGPTQTGVCTATRAGTTITCTLPHCVKCGSHFRKPLHTEIAICPVCERWARFYLGLAPGQAPEPELEPEPEAEPEGDEDEQP